MSNDTPINEIAPDEFSPLDLKRCTKCDEWKPSTAEYFRTRRNQCRECDREYNRRYYESNAEKAREYARRYRETNPNEVKESHRRYREANLEKEKVRYRRWYEANSEKRKEYSRRWRQANPEKWKEYNLRWRKENFERVKEYRQRYYKVNAEKIKARGHRYRQANPEALSERHRRYRQANPEKTRELDRRRYTLKHSRPFAFTAEDEAFAIEYFHGHCAICGEPLRDLFGERKLHMDHWIPISDPRPDNPGTVPSNMLPTCSKCNQSKSAHDPCEWLVSKFGKRKATQIVRRVETFFVSVGQDSLSGQRTGVKERLSSRLALAGDLRYNSSIERVGENGSE